MRIHVALAAVVFVVGGPRSAGAGEDRAAAAIARYVEAIGGAGTLAAIEDRTHKFENRKFSSSADVTQPAVARLAQYIKKGFKVREEWEIQDVQVKGNQLGFIQTYDGLTGWVLMFGSASRCEGRSLALFVWDKFLDDPLCHWQEDGYRAAFAGKGTVEDEPADVVELTDFTGAKKETFFFSTRSGLLLKKEWREARQSDDRSARKARRAPAPAGDVTKAILYKKYEAIPFGDGSGRKVKFPLSHEVYEDGRLDTRREFKEVKINGGLPDALFEKPGSTAGSPAPKEMPESSFPGQVKASHILLASSGEAESVRKAIVEAGGSLKEFVDAARRHSKDVTTKRAGGALGWFTRQKMVKEFSDAAFALKPGEISKPVRTPFGWHLIFMEASGDQPRRRL